MTKILFVVALCLVTASGPAAARDAENLVRELRGVTHRGGKSLSTEEIDHGRLAALLPQVLRLEARPDDLWERIPSDEFPGTPGIRLYDVLFSALSAAARSASTDADRERWLRQELALVKRMLQAPRTQRAYAEKHDEQRSASDHVSVLRLLSLELPAVKALLKRFRFLRPDEWTVVRGVTVVDEPGAVVLRGGKPYLSPRAVALLGLPAGTRPVAVAELVRRRTLEAEIDEHSQVVQLRPVQVGPRRFE